MGAIRPLWSSSSGIAVIAGVVYAGGLDGLQIFDFGPEYVEVREIEIDIKPRSPANVIDPGGRGVILVAILGFDRFDVADVYMTTLAFGPSGAARRPIPNLGTTALPRDPKELGGNSDLDWQSRMVGGF